MVSKVKMDSSLLSVGENEGCVHSWWTLCKEAEKNLKNIYQSFEELCGVYNTCPLKVRRHGIIALEPVTNHSLVSVAVKKAKTEKERVWCSSDIYALKPWMF